MNDRPECVMALYLYACLSCRVFFAPYSIRLILLFPMRLHRSTSEISRMRGQRFTYPPYVRSMTELSISHILIEGKYLVQRYYPEQGKESLAVMIIISVHMHVSGAL